MIRKSFTFWVWGAVAALAICNILYYDLKIITGPDTLQVQYVPDDAYYYLGLARNFTQFHTWTFDSGISKTTGFHLLYAYLLAAIYGLFHPSAAIFVISALVLGSITTFLVTIYLLWLGIRARNTFFFLALACIACSPYFVMNSTTGVEWPFVVLIAALFCGTLYTKFSNPHLPIILFFLGFLGSLARSDFALLPGSFFVAGTFVWIKNKDRFLLRALAWGLAGAIIGIAVVFIHNYFFSGSWLQSSAIIKAHWAEYSSGNRLLPFLLAASLIFGLVNGGIEHTLFLISLMPLVVTVVPQFIKRKKSTSLRAAFPPLSTRATIFIIGAIIAWYGYGIFYLADGAVQFWYTANFILPSLILVAGLGQYLVGKYFETPDTVLSVLLFPILFLFVYNFQAIYPLGSKMTLWPQQQSMLAAGKYLHDHPVSGNLAAWNAGIIGYYQGGHVINIDGLVNNDVYPYIIANTLPAYLDSKNIMYIVDTQTMLDERFRLMGGYNDSAFIQSLKPIKLFDLGEAGWKPLTLYRIKR